MSSIFGGLLLEGLRAVATKRKRSLNKVKQEIADELGFTPHNVDRWCYKGDVPADVKHVKYLAKYCVLQGRVERDWLDNLLRSARYPEREELVAELFPIAQEKNNEPKIRHNLPSRYAEFIGRDSDLKRVTTGLISGWSRVVIEGLPGIGKTVLATEVANRFVSNPEYALNNPYEVIVWISASGQLEQKSWLGDVFNRIADVFGVEHIIELPPERKRIHIEKLLQKTRTLIILDNFNTMIDDQDLRTWIYLVPEQCQILLTARDVNIHDAWIVQLEGIKLPFAFELVRSIAKAKNLVSTATAGDHVLEPLVLVTDGNPAAIQMALGQIKYGSTLDEVVDHLSDGTEEVKDIFKYIVAWAWDLLPRDAQELLLVVPFFANTISKSALGAVSGLSGVQLEEALGQVVGRSLVRVEGELERRDRRYSVHPIVRIFVGSQLLKHQEWEAQARERWVKYYLNFLEERMRREKISEPYWRYLGGGLLMSIRHEWQNILNLLKWVDRQQQHLMLVELVTRLVHYMDRNAYHPIRLEYARKAASAAHVLGQHSLEALFRIDALGVTWRKIGQFEAAIHEIKMGLTCIDHLDPQNEDTDQLHALGFTFLAKTYSEKGDADEASEWIEQAIKLAPKCTPVLCHRIYMTDGDIMYSQGRYDKAQERYLQALKMVTSYSMEGDTDAAGVHRKLGYCYLALQEFQQAETEFDEVIQYKTQGGVLNDVYAKFGLAKVRQAQDQAQSALQLTIEAKKVLEGINADHPLLKDINRFIHSID